MFVKEKNVLQPYYNTKSISEVLNVIGWVISSGVVVVTLQHSFKIIESNVSTLE
jgi:hypothetical protein